MGRPFAKNAVINTKMECNHDLEYCAHCDVEFCLLCGQEWRFENPMPGSDRQMNKEWCKINHKTDAKP